VDAPTQPRCVASHGLRLRSPLSQSPAGDRWRRPRCPWLVVTTRRASSASGVLAGLVGWLVGVKDGSSGAAPSGPSPARHRSCRSTSATPRSACSCRCAGALDRFAGPSPRAAMPAAVSVALESPAALLESPHALRSLEPVSGATSSRSSVLLLWFLTLPSSAPGPCPALRGCGSCCCPPCSAVLPGSVPNHSHLLLFTLGVSGLELIQGWTWLGGSASRPASRSPGRSTTRSTRAGVPGRQRRRGGQALGGHARRSAGAREPRAAGLRRQLMVDATRRLLAGRRTGAAAASPVRRGRPSSSLPSNDVQQARGLRDRAGDRPLAAVATEHLAGAAVVALLLSREGSGSGPAADQRGHRCAAVVQRAPGPALHDRDAGVCVRQEGSLGPAR
jgi:hypothetical protein